MNGGFSMLCRRAVALALATALAVASAPVTEAGAAGTTATPRWGICPPPAPGSFPRDPRTECAALAVPLDYRKPHGRQITVTISRIRTAQPGLRRGILLSNPGGPGGPGLDLPGYLASALPAEVLARYDLIGFDPRGVGNSTPITCGIAADTPVDLILPYPAPDGSIDRNVAFARSTARSCAARSGDLLPYITTANTARDMDRIRAALGERKMSYLGYSYGTYLGAVYTSLFPQRSDRIILDSAVDPKLVWYGVWSQFSTAVALRLPDFAAWAAERDDVYGLGATPQAVTRTYFTTAAKLDRDPVVLPDLVINGNVFRELTRSALYDDRNFPVLAQNWQALSAATAPAALAAALPPDNSVAVLWAIACDDVAWPRDMSMYARNSATDRRRFPITAGMPPNVWPCASWPYRPIEHPVAVTGNGPRNVLVMQNLRDPATGWQSGYGLRKALAGRAAMVTQDAGGHGVYAIRSGPCASGIATTFLVTGVLPGDDRFCPGPSPDDVSLTATAPTVPIGPLGIATGG
jgi:pimeloyl-ACP methyl ester carboxylesterase